MTSRFIDPIPQYTNDAGEPLAGGKLYFYDSGTTSFRNTYSDAGLTIANANPVILDSAGRPPSIFLQGNYKLVITDSDDVQLSERDPVSGSSTAGEYTDWSITTTYSLNQSVRGSDGEYYTSITNDNLGNNPTSSAANWSKIVGLTEWNTNQTYALNDTVRRNGILYRSTANSNQGSAPESLVDWASLNPASTADAVVTISSPDTRIASEGVGDVFVRADGTDVARFDANENTYLLGDLIMNEGAGNERNVETDLAAIEAGIATNTADITTAQSDITSLQSQVTSNDSDISALQADKATIPIIANATSVWTGSATTVASGSITGGLTVGAYIVEYNIGYDVNAVIHVVDTAIQYFPLSQDGIGPVLNHRCLTLSSGTLGSRVDTINFAANPPTNTTTFDTNLTYKQIWRVD